MKEKRSSSNVDISKEEDVKMLMMMVKAVTAAARRGDVLMMVMFSTKETMQLQHEETEPMMLMVMNQKNR